MVRIEDVVLGLVLGSCLLAALYDVELNSVSKQLHSRRKRYQRLAVWLPLGITYSLFYTTRYNIIAGNIGPIREMLGFSTGNFGLVFTSGFWTYAISAPFTGMLADRMGSTKTLLLAVTGAGLSNLALGTYFAQLEGKASLAVFMLFYSLNIFFQGFGTAGIIKMNGSIYHEKERGIFSGLFNILITSGYFIALAVCPRFIDAFGWAYVFLLPGGGLLVCAVAIIFVAPSPQFAQYLAQSDVASGEQSVPPSATLPSDGLLTKSQTPSCSTPAEDTSSDLVIKDLEAQQQPPVVDVHTPLTSSQPSCATVSEPGAPNMQTLVPSAPVKRSPIMELLTNPTFPYYLGAIMCSSWVRDGLLTWMYSFFGNAQGAPIDSAAKALIGGGVTFGGFVGGVLCGAISDRCFNRQRIPPVLLFSCCQLAALVLLYILREEAAFVHACLIFLICVFLLGNYTLLSYTVPTDLPPHIVGVAAGVLTAGGYIASGLSGFLLGTTIELAGYLAGWFSTLLAATLLGVALVLFAFMRSRQKQRSTPTPPPSLLPDLSVHSEPFTQVYGSSDEMPRTESYDSELMVLAGSEFVPYQAVTEQAVCATKTVPVRLAGIQDEHLRCRWDSGQFHQWPDQSSGVAERINWRLEKLEPRKEDQQFLSHRINDPTSFFGNVKKEDKTRLFPY